MYLLRAHQYPGNCETRQCDTIFSSHGLHVHCGKCGELSEHLRYLERRAWRREHRRWHADATAER